MSDRKQIVAVVGPTASGKSGLTMKIAAKYNGTIVCCDSMQIYRGMDIGTAKPTAEDMRTVPHRLFDIVDPRSSYSCADYASAARTAIDEISAAGSLPVFCGGTGLYLDSLLMPRSYSQTSGITAVRAELEAIAAKPNGKELLHAMLADIDPESAENIHLNNVRRTIRAIEIYRESGIPKSVLDRRSRDNAGETEYDALVIGLRYPDRSILRARISRRVDEMLECGLEAEVRRLMASGVFDPLPDGTPATAAQAIGYKEMLAAVQESTSLSEASRASVRDTIITATCRYAKRQMTWFGAKPYVRWIDITSDVYDPAPQAYEMLNEFLKKSQ